MERVSLCCSIVSSSGPRSAEPGTLAYAASGRPPRGSMSGVNFRAGEQSDEDVEKLTKEASVLRKQLAKARTQVISLDADNKRLRHANADLEKLYAGAKERWQHADRNFKVSTQRKVDQRGRRRFWKEVRPEFQGQHPEKSGSTGRKAG